MARHLNVIGSKPTYPARAPLALEVPDEFAADGLPALVDDRGRRYSYLRLSVTDRCDFACVYCMPLGGEDDHAVRPDLLTFEEAAQVVSVFAQLGINRVRFTGGEPLVRRDVVHMIELVQRRTGIDNLVMTTNASRLAELALPLAQAGLRGVNISLDSLDAARFRELTRGGELTRVLAGVHAALDAGLEVKLNIVALGGLNDAEAPRLVDWAWDLGITPRFIELMPLGEASKLPAERFVSHQQLIERLGTRVGPVARRSSLAREETAPFDPGEARAGTERFDIGSIEGQGPARYLAAADGSGRKVGFITAVSDEFCDSCNRVRVTARGDFRACLASRTAVSLRDAVRAGKSDRELAWLIHRALGSKLAGHFFDRSDVDEHRQVGMSLVGG